MGITLVFAGNHRQFVHWVRDEMTRGNVDASRAREILLEHHLRGISGADVDEIHYVGTYAKDNSVWMTPSYEMLMVEGRSFGKPWAVDEQEDIRRAYEVPVPPEQMAAVRYRLQEIERRLSE